MTTSAGWPAAAGPGQPLIGREAARELARRELARSIYHQRGSVVARAWARIVAAIDRLFQQAGTNLPGGWWALVALAVLAVIIATVVLSRLGPISAVRRGRRGPLAGQVAATARDHRARARQAAADGNWAVAIRESLRAIAMDLEERAILAPSAGRTADELAAEAGRVLPACGDRLRSAARLFDDVCYGGRSGTQDGYASLNQLADEVHAARPVPLQQAGPAGPGSQAPALQPAGHLGGPA